MSITRLVAVAFALAGAVAAQGGESCEAPVDQLEGYGSGTTGGGSAPAVTVSSCSALQSAVKEGGVIRVNGPLNNCGIIDVKSDTSIIGVAYNSGIAGGSLNVKDANNVIIRNLRFRQPPKGQHAIALNGASQVWIDHNEFQNIGVAGDEDYYGGQLDITHGSDMVTVSWNLFMDGWKASLVGDVAEADSEDSDRLHVTYHHNWWFNLDSQTPSLAYGTGHVYSSCFEHIQSSGLNVHEGAKALVEGNHFIAAKQAITTNMDTAVQGSVTERNNIFYESPIEITQTGHVQPPYEYTLDSASCICEYITSWAGAGLLKL